MQSEQDQEELENLSETITKFVLEICKFLQESKGDILIIEQRIEYLIRANCGHLASSRHHSESANQALYR